MIKGFFGKKHDIKVSVIIPLYNLELYAKEAIESVLFQSLKDVEVLCVNDGSTDGTQVMIESIYDPRVKLFNKENGGVSSTRNFGLDHAKGKYVYFLDGDDKLADEDVLQKMYKLAERKNLDALYFEGESFYDSAELERSNQMFKNMYSRKKQYKGVHSGRDLLAMFLKNYDMKSTVSGALYRRELFEENGLRFIEGIIHEDVVFSFHVLMLAKRVHCIQDKLFLRRVRENSIMTGSKKEYKMYSLLAVAKHIDDIICSATENRDVYLKYEESIIKRAANVGAEPTERILQEAEKLMKVCKSDGIRKELERILN